MARLVVSQNERLLLHLLEHDKYRDMAQVPLGLCQEGIARALEAKVHNVSRALSPLEAEGLVTDRLAHVQGAHRRRRAYFLTEKGREMAESTRTRIEKGTAMWQEDGKTQQLTIGEIRRRASMASRRVPSILTIVNLARRGEALTPSLVIKPDDGAIVGPVIREESHGRPRVDRFFGRVQELSTLMEALSSDEISVVQVYGMPGIGKSTLLSKAYDGLTGKKSLFWYTFREWDSELSLVGPLAGFLSDLGSRSLGRSLKAGTDVADMHPALIRDFKSVDAVVFLDDVHKVADRMELLLTMLIDAIRTSASVKLVFITRTAIHIVPKHVPQSLSMEVRELDHKSARQLVVSADIRDPDGLLRDGHGHPMLLNLMVSRGTGGGRRDVIDFFDSEIYSSLPAVERRALELLSVFRHPVLVEALSDVDYETISLLRRRSLIAEQDGGIWLHDLLRDYFTARLDAERKAQAHIAAGSYCERRPEVDCKLEALYHFAEVGEWAQASMVAISNGVELAREFPSETLGLVSKISESHDDGATLAQIIFLRGQLLEGMGRYEEALSDYEESASQIPEQDERRAAVLESLARLQAENDELSKSLEVHSRALALYAKAGDVEGQVRERLSIGVVQKRRGDAKGARGSYQEALSIATKAENRSAQAACLNNIAILDWEEGVPGDAEKRFRNSMHLAHAAKDHSGEARVLENYAQLCRSYNRLDESRHLLFESSDAHVRASDVAEAKRLRSLCAETMADQGHMTEAIDLCRAALSDQSLRKPKGLFHHVQSFDDGDTLLVLTLVSLLRISGDRGEANAVIEKHMRAVEPLEDPVLMAKLKLEQAMIAEDSNDLAGAVAALTEAEKLLSRAGDSEGLVAVHLRWGTVEEKRGDITVAAQHYTQAARHAEVAGNENAHTIALENLRAVEADK